MQILIAYELPAIFFGSFFFAEIVIIAAAFLAGQGVWPVWHVFLLALAGTLTADSVWFFVGRKLYNQLNRWEYTRVRYARFSKLLNHIAHRRSLATFFIIKFLYGTRVLMAMHFSASRLPYRFFIARDALATLAWLGVIISLGWVAGRGAFGIADVLGNVRAAGIALVAVLIAYRLANLWFNKRVLKDGETEE